jgi:hypothetical protein
MSLNIEENINLETVAPKRKHRHLIDLTLREVCERWSKTMLQIIDECSDFFGNERPPSFSQGIGGAKRILGKKHRLFYVGITCIFLAIAVFYVHISS